MSKTKRATYRFNLPMPEAFTIRKLRQLTYRKFQYITIRKRVEAALVAGTIIEVAKFRPKSHRRGRLQSVYAQADVENVQLVVEKAFADKGEIVAL